MYEYPPPVWAPPPTPKRRSRVLPILVGVGLSIALVLAIGVVVLMVQVRSASASVTREPVNTARNPFMPPVGDDQTSVVPPPDSGGTFTASTPGLYGGTLNKASCDARKMVDFLQANADKAGAWASVLGLSPADIDSYVSRLTSVILRADTIVVNHGFRDGKATRLVSVLQAGTAVLINQLGLPVVKCYCGNPLKEYTGPTRRTYTGPSWPAFNPGQVVTVRATTTPVSQFTIVDVATGEAYTRKPGPIATDTSTASASPSPPTLSPTAPPPTTVPPTAAPPRAVPPTTVPPRTVPPTTVPPRTTGQQAEALLRSRVQACANVKYPWPPHARLVYGSSNASGDVWRVTIDGHHHDGSVQNFVWYVDPAAKSVRPGNQNATIAGAYCPGLAN